MTSVLFLPPRDLCQPCFDLAHCLSPGRLIAEQTYRAESVDCETVQDVIDLARELLPRGFGHPAADRLLDGL